MQFIIKHEIKGRIRIHMQTSRLTYKQADTLYYYLHNTSFVTFVKVYEMTQDVVLCYVGERSEVIQLLCKYDHKDVDIPDGVLQSSGRELNAYYLDKLATKIIFRGIRKFILPYPIRVLFVYFRAGKYLYKGLLTLKKRKIEVPLLDAVAIGISVMRKDLETAGSIMFLLGIGELLEEWTHKKSVDDLAKSLSLNVEKVWMRKKDQLVLAPISSIQKEDIVYVHTGNVIPFDGSVLAGEAMINQSSLTGEAIPIRKAKDSYVYAGTVIEEGQISLQVKELGGSSRFEKIVTMIEESEKLKSNLQGNAEHLADRLVPYTFAGAILTYFLTNNFTKALSVLMVDFSCAIKLAMPISILSAIRESSLYNITIKGGRFLEVIAEADTIVFDKTGTLTKARPSVVEVISFDGSPPNELLRTAACLEEHFPHSMAKAVVHAAKKKQLEHSEMHTKVDYIVAHGISTTINGDKVIIGSSHFVFEDEQCKIPEGKENLFEELKPEFSHLYMAKNGILTAVIYIEDPVREEAEAVVNSLRKLGISKMVMMTGDSERTAKAIAEKIGFDEYYAEVLPEDKAAYIEQEKSRGRKVIMIGDGINDSPALSTADAGIAINDGAAIAREISDITIGADDLFQLVTLKAISDGLVNRIGNNYHIIVAVNTLLILLGVTGTIQPTTSSLLHNSSTLLISLKSMQNLLA